MPLPPVFRRYLRDLGMTDPLIQRVGEVYDFYRRIVRGPMPGLVVSEYVTGEGQRQYESLWFFTPRLAMEAKQFLTMDDFDITPIFRRVVYAQVRKENYDFRRATDQSRLYVQAVDEASVELNIKASGSNCDHLRDVFGMYIMANLKARTG